MKTASKRKQAETLEAMKQRLETRLQRLEARDASRAQQIKKLQQQVALSEVAPVMDDVRRNGSGNAQLVMFWDDAGPSAPIAVVRRDLLATGADALHALFAERNRLIAQLQDQRRQRQSALNSHEHWALIARGGARAFPGQGAPNPDEKVAPARKVALEQEIESLNPKIEEAEKRLEQILAELRRDFVGLRLVRPNVYASEPTQTARGSGEE